MLPAQLNPAMRGGELQYVPTRQSPDLMVLETRVTDLSEGKSEVIVSSSAETSLILQLYRPDLEEWQEYQLAPLSNTGIACPQCGGKFKFSFNDGVEQSEIAVEPPSLLRIYPDSDDTRWKWDVLKLQATSSGTE
ncbi:MAG: hypothetical protein ACSLE4_04655 [Methyloceanibacter sp.]|uniref:hypothetical protein n=1 Tax=Methyloceanibacter sp. TaxID=1965321 RepID=UPI003EE26191